MKLFEKVVASCNPPGAVLLAFPRVGIDAQDEHRRRVLAHRRIERRLAFLIHASHQAHPTDGPYRNPHVLGLQFDLPFFVPGEGVRECPPRRLGERARGEQDRKHIEDRPTCKELSNIQAPPLSGPVHEQSAFASRHRSAVRTRPDLARPPKCFTGKDSSVILET